MLSVMSKYTREKRLSELLQTNNKQFTIAVTFLTGYKGACNVTNKKIKFYFTVSITDVISCVISTLLSAYENESSNNENKRNIIEEGFLQNPIILLQLNN